jgi:hypothetical protein
MPESMPVARSAPEVAPTVSAPSTHRSTDAASFVDSNAARSACTFAVK